MFSSHQRSNIFAQVILCHNLLNIARNANMSKTPPVCKKIWLLWKENAVHWKNSVSWKLLVPVSAMWVFYVTDSEMEGESPFPSQSPAAGGEPMGEGEEMDGPTPRPPLRSVRDRSPTPER